MSDDFYEGRVEKGAISRIPIIPGFTEYESALKYLGRSKEQKTSELTRKDIPISDLKM